MNKPKHRIIGLAIDHPKLVIVLSILVTLLALAALPFATVDTDPENMLSADEPVRRQHSSIKEEFSLHDYLVVGFAGDEDLLTGDFVLRLGTLVESIEMMEGVVADDILAPSTVDDIYRTPTGAMVVAGLTEERIGWDVQPSVSAKVSENPMLKGKLASADGHVVAIYIPLEEKRFAHVVSEEIAKEMDAIGGFSGYHITGLPVAQDTFGKEMFRQMGISAPLAGLLIFLLMLFFFRKAQVVAAPMIIAVMTVSITMGLLIASGFTVHIMSSMIPIFLMPIAVLNSIHILSEFHERYQLTRSRRAAIISTMDELFNPMIFTTATTVVGFGSLIFAPIPPVRVFGAFVAFGVALAWLLSITFNPAFAVLLSKKTLANFGKQDEGTGPLGRLLPRLGAFASRRRIAIVAVTAASLIVAAVGISRIVVNDNPTKWFKADHPIRVAEQVLGSKLAGTYLTYLAFDAAGTDEGSIATPETLHFIDSLQDRLEALPQVGATSGVTDIVKKVRFELANGDSAMHGIPDDKQEIAQELFLYEVAGGNPDDLYNFITPDYEKGVLWIQLRDGDNQSVEAVVAAATAHIEGGNPPAGMSFAWGGLPYINVIWQNKMVGGMRNALIGSFIVVLVMMTLLLRSVFLGLISMLPLTVTIALVYGLVGLTGKPYDMPIAVLSSLTLGLSVDFAIHFLKRGQELFRRSGSAERALAELFQEPARAISRNIVVIALGFVPLLFAALMPYVTVGVFFLAIMGLSGTATLFILPAMISLRGKNAFRTWGQAPAGAGAQNFNMTSSADNKETI